MSRTRARASATRLRRAAARRRARLEWAAHRDEVRRRRYEERAHLDRENVHLRPATMAESDEADVQPSPAVLSSGDAQPFTEAVSLHLGWREMPAPLRGSLELLERQDERLEAAGLKSIQTEDDLAASIADKQLVPLPESSGLAVNANLKENHRYCRPWTAQFLKDLARAHEAVFHHPLEVSSAVRPATYQEHLERINHNAAPAEGDVVSPHMMGATIDIAKHGLSRREIAWMRLNLLPLEEAGKIDVEEEFRQSCFHITVYPSYAPSHKDSPGIRTAAAPVAAAPAAPDADAPGAATPAAISPAADPDAAPQKSSEPAPVVPDNSTGS